MRRFRTSFGCWLATIYLACATAAVADEGQIFSIAAQDTASAQSRPVLVEARDRSGEQEVTAAAEVPFSARNFNEDVLVLRVDHLLGDWWGVRTGLEDNGITPSLTFVSDMLGNPAGGMRQGFTEANNLGFNVVFDLEKRHGVDGGTFLFSMSQRSGVSLSNNYIGNIFGAQQVFGAPTFHVVDLAYRQKLLDDDVEFRIGRVGTSDDFLVSPYNYGFVQNGFDGCPQGIFINAPGMSGYPNATWGTLLRVQTTDRTYAMGGLYNGDTSIRDLDNHGLDLSLRGPLFAIVEVGYERNQLKGDDGLVGNYKFGAWYDGNEFPDLAAQALATAIPGLAVPVHTGNYGFYGLFDQVLIRFSAPGEEILRGLGIVTAVVVAPDQTLSQMPYFFNCGIAARGIWPERPKDTAGFGVIYGNFSHALRSGERAAQQINPGTAVQQQEIALEWTYIFRFRGGAYFLQPDFQYIIQPNGNRGIPNAFVLGTQVGINF